MNKNLFEDVDQEVLDHEFDDEDPALVSHVLDLMKKDLGLEDDGFITLYPPMDHG